MKVGLRWWVRTQVCRFYGACGGSGASCRIDWRLWLLLDVRPWWDVTGVSSGARRSLSGAGVWCLMENGIGNVLVTGGAGFIGGNFVLQAISLGHRVINLDALTYAGHLRRSLRLMGARSIFLFMVILAIVRW